jgi:uncharacterized protein YkwD
VPVKNESPTRSRSSNAFEVERRAFDLTNAERQASGLSLLVWDNAVAELARSHARNMAENKFFSHKSADGETVDGRAKQMGVRWLGIGENIATMKGYDDPASVAVQNWMRSTGHKRNILNGQFQVSAIGAAVANDGTIYFAQVFIMR